jgi:hypothetical protein
MNIKALQSQLQLRWRSTLRLRILLFLILLVVLYGFIAWRISTLANVQPDEAAVSSKLKTTSTPHIDQSVVDKIKQLEDNSVNVQTLFDQARQNPFRE